MAFTTAPTHVPGDTLPSADWNILANDLNSGVMRELADSTLGASAASFDFTSIPQTFAHLLLVTYLRDDDALTKTLAFLRFNADSGANYDRQRLEVSNTTVSGSEGLTQTSGIAVVINGASSPASLFNQGMVLIPHYTGSTNKKGAVAISGKQGSGTGNNVLSLDSATWQSTAAITRITVIPAAGNFVAGSRLTLYGVPS